MQARSLCGRRRTRPDVDLAALAALRNLAVASENRDSETVLRAREEAVVVASAVEKDRVAILEKQEARLH